MSASSHPAEDPPVPTVRVVGALVRDGDLVLLTQRRPDADHPLCWEFPGGKVEAGETDAEALRRELREELDADALVGPLYLAVQHRLPRFMLDLRVHRCVLAAGILRPLGVHALRWVRMGGGVDESVGLPVPPADAPVLRLLRADAGLPEEPASPERRRDRMPP